MGARHLGDISAGRKVVAADGALVPLGIGSAKGHAMRLSAVKDTISSEG